MRSAVRGELEPARAPLLDLRPTQVGEAIPGVLDVPGIRLADVVGNQKRGGGEAEVGEHRIGMLGEGCIAVVEGEQKPAWGVGCGEWDSELVEGHRSPTRARERRHLPHKDRTACSSDAQLERAADAVITEDRRKRRQCGHIHVNTAHVTSAKTTPSNVDLRVIAHDRRYQIDICHSAKV